jgi:hypothetical protein
VAVALAADLEERQAQTVWDEEASERV